MDNSKVNVKDDLVGRKFHRLIVLKQAEDYIDKRGKHYAQWRCKCDCGNEIVALGNHLKRGNTKSCGCLNDERRIENNKIYKKKYNTYDLSGVYGIGYTSNNEEFWFDLEDYDLIKDYCWSVNSQGYIIAPNLNDSRKIIKMHRLILGCPDNYDIDHIHGKETRHDNRKRNLRIATRSQNNMNKGLQSNNTSNTTGVSWHKGIGRWQAYITIDRKRIYLGAFANFDEAVNVRKQAEEKYFGEFSYDNSMRYINGQQAI